MMAEETVAHIKKRASSFACPEVLLRSLHAMASGGSAPMPPVVAAPTPEPAERPPLSRPCASNTMSLKSEVGAAPASQAAGPAPAPSSAARQAKEEPPADDEDTEAEEETDRKPPRARAANKPKGKANGLGTMATKRMVAKR